MTDLRFYRDGAKTMGACEERGCGGVMMVVEDMDAWTWCQCARCLKQAGVHQGGVSQGAERAGVESAPSGPDYGDDAFLGAT